jgi:hypothetical protein
MSNGRSKALLARLYSGPGRAVCALTAFFFTLSSGAGLLTGMARAGDLPRVLVLPYAPIFDGVSADTGRKTAEVLDNELKGSEQVQLVMLDPQAFAPATRPVNPAPVRDEALLTEARERNATAQDYLKKLKFKPASDELEKVIGLLESQHPYIDIEQLVAAYLDLAVANFRLGQDEDGEKLLAQVVRLDPEHTLSADQYPPVFIRIFDQTARRVKAAPRATVRVEPTVAGTSVLLDGREVGTAPLTIKDVIAGTHFLRVLPPGGGEPWADKVKAGQGEAVRVAPDLGSTGGPVADLMAALSTNAIDEATAAKAAALGEKAGAEYVVLGGVHKENDSIVVSSHLLRVSTRKLCLLQRVVFDLAMLGAGIEVYKIGADVGNRVEVFGEAEPLPAKVARDAIGSGTAVAGSGEPNVRGSDGKPAIVHRGDEGGATTVVVNTEPRTEVRSITASGEPQLFDEPGGREPATVKKDGSLTWLWVTLGVVAVGGLVGGGVVYYTQASKPVTGSGPVSW